VLKFAFEYIDPNTIEIAPALQQYKMHVQGLAREIGEAYRLINRLVGQNPHQLSDTEQVRFFQDVQRFNSLFDKIIFETGLNTTMSESAQRFRSGAERMKIDPATRGLAERYDQRAIYYEQVDSMLQTMQSLDEKIIAFDAAMHAQHTTGPLLEWSMTQKFGDDVIGHPLEEEIIDVLGNDDVVDDLFAPVRQELDRKAVASMRVQLLRFAQVLRNFPREQQAVLITL